MPIYTGDKMGFGVAPGEGGGASGPEVGYSTSFDNISHSKRTEHKWIVPKTARYNFEVWGADGGMGIAANGDNNNGGIPRYGRGGKVEASFLLDAGTEIGIMIGDNGLPAFSYSGNDTGTYLNDGAGGWGGEDQGEGLADGGNSQYNYHTYGGAGSFKEWRGGGGGGGTIVRLFGSTTNTDYLIVAGGGGGAGARGRDHGNSNNQGGSGGNANDKVNETQWGRRGYYAGDTSWGWPSGNGTNGQGGDSSNGGQGGTGYYNGGAGGGGGCGGGGGGATCTYCGGQGGSGGSCGNTGNTGSAGYNNASAGRGASQSGIQIHVGSGGSSNTQGKGGGGGGGGGYRGGGAGHWGNGQGHAGAGGGGGASSYCMGVGNSYDVKGLNGLTATPRYTAEQKPLRLGNPGGGRVFIWEANKDPLGKERPAEMTADKIQYLCRSQNGGPSNNQRLYYLGSCSSGSESTEDGGGHDHAAYNNYPYQTPSSTCDAVVMEISGTGLWELHSVTVGQGQGYDYPLPYRHQCWVHIIEGTETGGVGIHTEKFDSNNPTGNPGVAGWYAHKRACVKEQNTDDGYIELFFEKPAVMKRGEKYTIALDWSCGGTNTTDNNGGMACMNNGAVSARQLIGSNKGTATWSGVTAYNGPHGLGSKNSNNGMETSASQGLMCHFGVRSVEITSGGGGGGGGGSSPYVTNGLIFNVDASDSSSYSGSGNTWTDIQGSNNVSLTNCSYSSSHGGGITFDGVSQWSIGEFTTPFTADQAHTWEVWTDGTWTTGWPGSPYTWILHNSSQGQSTGSSYLTIGIDASNYFFGALDGRFTSMADSNQTSTNSTVHHLILTWDRSIQIFYVDGNQGPSFSTPGYSSWQNNSSFNTTTTIGEAIGGNYRPLKGNVYSVRCWDRALSTSEVTTNWNGNKAKFGR